MPNLTEEILVTLQGRDQATPVVNNFARNVQSSLDGASQQASNSAEAIAQSYSSTFDQIGQGIHQLNSGMISLKSASGMLMQEIGSYKSAMDWVYGTTSKEDTNKVLVKNMVSGVEDVEEAYESLYTKIDKTTDSSLTSMQDLIPAMNAFKSATQATPGQLENFVAEDMAEFGAFVLAQTGSEQLALTAMMDLSKGIKGQFNALDQYGISLASMESTGLWNPSPDLKEGNKWKGDEHDIEGYMNAVMSLIGDTSALMDTNEGLNAQMGKMWSRAGKRIGHEVMPGLKSIKQMFIDLDTEMNGDLSTGVLRVALAIEETQQKAYMFNTLFDSAKNISGILKGVLQYFGFFVGAEEEATLATQMNSDALAENTDMLLMNADAKLANADASYAMSGASMMPMGDVPYNVPQQTTTGMAKQEALTMGEYVGSDLATDAIVSKITNKNAGDTLNSLKDIKNQEKVYQDYIDALSRYEAEYVRDRIGSSMVGDEGNVVLDELLDVGNANRRINIPMKQEKFGAKLPKSDSDSLASRIAQQISGDGVESFYGVTGDNLSLEELKEISEWNKYADMDIPVNNWDSSRFKSSIDATKSEKEKVLSMLEGGVSASDIAIPTATKKLKESSDTLEDEIEKIYKEPSVSGPFTRLEAFFSEKKKRNIPSLDIDKDDKKYTELLYKKSQANKSIEDGVGRLGASYRKLSGGIDNLKGLSTAEKLDSIWDSIKGGFGSLRGGSKTAEIADDVGDGVKEVIEDTEKVAQTAGTAGVIGGEMAEAEAGLSFMGLAEMGLAGAFETLLIPTLAIAGVIAILIPVVAGLAIEALFFINIVAQMMEAMNFEDIDVSGATESLQEIATALAWLGVAMASMTFAGIMSGIGMISASLLALVGGIPQVVNLLTTVAEEMQPLSEITVDPSIADNVKTVGDTLNSMSMAMLSLSGLQLSVGLSTVLDGFGLFSRTFGDAITRAKNDIQRAIDAINTINFASIDESKAQQVATTMEAIKSFADAFNGLTKIRADNAISDFVAWILDGGIFGNGGKSIAEAFSLAQKDIEDASNAISQFTNVSDIDQTTVDRLTKVGDSIKAMGDAFEGLRKIRDDSNWDAMFDEGGLLSIFKGKHDIASAFDEVKPLIARISKSLKSFKIDDIPEDIPQRLQKVTDTLTSITSAIDQLKGLQDKGGKKGVNFDNYVNMVDQVRKDLVKISRLLNSMGDGKGKNDLIDIPDGVNENIVKIAKTLDKISKSIELLNTIDTATNKGNKMSGFAETIRKTRTSLVQISKELQSIGNGKGKNEIATIPDGLDDKIRAVARTLKGIASAITQMSNIETSSQNAGTNFENYRRAIYNAKIGLSKVSKTLHDMGDGKGEDNVFSIDSGLADKIKAVTNTLLEIAYALDNMKGIYKIGHKQEKDGFENYRRTIYNAKVGLNKVSKSLKDMKISDIDSSQITKIKTVTKTLQKVNEAMSEMESMFSQFGGNKQKPSDGTTLNNPLANVKTGGKGDSGKTKSNIENYKTVIQESSQALVSVSAELSKLGDKKGGLKSVKGVGSSIKQVSSALNQLSKSASIMKKFPKMSGNEVPLRVQKAVTALQNSAKWIRKINSKDKVGKDVTNIINNIGDAIKTLKSTLKTIDFKPEGEQIGTKIKTGIGSGLKNLGSTVSTKITSATRTSASAGWTMGATIGESVTRGFASALRLTEIVAQQLQQAQTQVNNATSSANATGDLVTGDTATTEGATTSDGGSGTTEGATSSGTGTNTEGMRVLARNSRRMVNSLNYANLDINRLNQNRNESLKNMNSKSTMGKGQQSVSINIGEGAVQLDARNMTTKESRQIMINALEGLNMVKGVSVKR